MIDMRTSVFLALVVFAATCGPDPNAKLPGWAEDQGGSQGSGGVTDTGGSNIGSGGVVGSGGTTVVGHGGVTSTGGKGKQDAGSSTGGRGSGGIGAGGDGGTTIPTGTGGRIGKLDGGGLGSGGIVGPKDAALPPSPDVAPAGCPGQIVSNDYACGSATACSGCKDTNGFSKEAGCKASFDCLVAAGASCDTNCQQNCLNKAGDSPAMACVKALQTACSTSGCAGTPPPNSGG
jgi:hypothetical protein